MCAPSSRPPSARIWACRRSGCGGRATTWRRGSRRSADARVLAMTLAEDSRVEVLRKARVDLAAALRAAALHGYNEGIDNHFSYAVPGTDDLFLLNPYGPDWSELVASDILLVDGDGNVVDGEGEWETT